MTKNTSGKSRSLWMEVSLPAFQTLDKDLNADICIVGAGIVGLTCAYTLAKQGKSVVVVEQGKVAGGQTSRTTGHLTWVLDDRYYNLETFFGTAGAKTAAESHSAAVDYIEKIIEEEQIDCDFDRVDGYLFVPPEDSKDVLEQEYKAILKTGKTIHKVSRAPFSETFDTGTALHFPNQAEFHVLKYLKGLSQAILKYGGKIYENTHINHIEEGSTCLVKTQNGEKISSQALIIATCSPINNRFFIHTKQAAYQTYVIGALVPKGYVPKGLYWDTPDPYHYIRIQKNDADSQTDWLLVGGEDHRTGQDPAINEKYIRIEKWARVRFPKMGDIKYRWSGEIFEPVDSLGFIGKNPMNKNVYISTGDSGNGLTHGTIAGILIPDLILGRKNPWSTLYDPSRKTLSSVPIYVEENLNTATQYGDWFTDGEKEIIDALPPDEGIVIRKGVKKFAVYKDAQGNVHTNSAMCPHLGGCVRWNTGEKTWDCPCHGSRFDGRGKVLNGPAKENLG